MDIATKKYSRSLLRKGSRIVLAGAVLCCSGMAYSQEAVAKPAAAPVTIATDDIRPVMDRVNQAVSAVNVAKWKAPSEVKGQSQADIASVQRNLSTALPALLDQAHAAPSSIAPAFAVYRNLSALYDVMLRISETASLAGPQQEAISLDEELKGLEAARKALGTSILDAASARDAEVLQLRASLERVAAQSAAVQTPPKKVVVNDGAVPASRRKKKAAPATPPAQ